MKTFKIFIFTLLLSSISAFSQGYYNQRSGYGLDRQMANAGNNAYAQSKPTAEDYEKNRTERIEKLVTQLKEELTLDELQVIAIRNEITANSKNIDIVMKKENSDEEKNKEVKAMMEQTEAKINTYLNNAQKEKFKVFSANKVSGKKEKKGKKDKQSKAAETPIEE